MSAHNNKIFKDYRQHLHSWSGYFGKPSTYNRHQVPHPHKRTGKITILNILILVIDKSRIWKYGSLNIFMLHCKIASSFIAIYLNVAARSSTSGPWKHCLKSRRKFMKWPVAEPTTFIPTSSKHSVKESTKVTQHSLRLWRCFIVITRAIRQQCNSYIAVSTLVLIWIIKEKRKFAQSKLFVRAMTRWSIKNWPGSTKLNQPP